MTSQHLFTQVTVDTLKVVKTKPCMDESLEKRISIPSEHLVKPVELGVLSKETLAHQPPPAPPPEESISSIDDLCILYIRGQNEKLEKTCNAPGINTAFRPANTLYSRPS